jgi:hypothetical protein
MNADGRFCQTENKIGGSPLQLKFILIQKIYNTIIRLRKTLGNFLKARRQQGQLVHGSETYQKVTFSDTWFKCLSFAEI